MGGARAAAVARLGEPTHAPTPGQTVGPFFAFGLGYPRMHHVVSPHAPGSIVLGGSVLDGAGAAVPDAVVEIWSADADGRISRERGALRRDDHTFTGFGRSATDDDGRYELWTVDPGSVHGEAPFYAVVVVARGLPDRLHTRIYLPEDEVRLAADPLLGSLEPEERATLVATRLPNGHLQHDIRLQGDRETVFLAF